MNIKPYIIFLLIFLSLAYFPVRVAAQTMPQNISTVKVDELSDGQVRQLMQHAASSNITDTQLVQLAQSKGMTVTEAEKLQARIGDIRKKEGGSSGLSNNFNYSDT